MQAKVALGDPGRPANEGTSCQGYFWEKLGVNGDQRLELCNQLYFTLTSPFRRSSRRSLTRIRTATDAAKFRFSLKDVGLDAPQAGEYFGPVVNTTNGELIALVMIDVF
jgi:hypothetical protein